MRALPGEKGMAARPVLLVWENPRAGEPNVSRLTHRLAHYVHSAPSTALPEQSAARGAPGEAERREPVRHKEQSGRATVNVNSESDI